MTSNLYNIENNTINYDTILDSSIVSVPEYVNSNRDKIHKELYDAALEKYIEENLDGDASDYRFIECKNETYYLPSSIYKISKKKPYNKEKVDLTDYWPEYYFNNTDNFINLEIDKDSNIEDVIVRKIDYVNGIATLMNRITLDEFTVPFNRISRDIMIDDNLFAIDTFSYLINTNQVL